MFTSRLCQSGAESHCLWSSCSTGCLGSDWEAENKDRWADDLLIITVTLLFRSMNLDWLNFTHMVLHGHVFSRQAHVGFGDSRLDDHLLQELGVNVPVTESIHHQSFISHVTVPNADRFKKGQLVFQNQDTFCKNQRIMFCCSLSTFHYPGYFVFLENSKHSKKVLLICPVSETSMWKKNNFTLSAQTETGKVKEMSMVVVFFSIIINSLRFGESHLKWSYFSLHNQVTTLANVISSAGVGVAWWQLESSNLRASSSHWPLFREERLPQRLIERQVIQKDLKRGRKQSGVRNSLKHQTEQRQFVPS